MDDPKNLLALQEDDMETSFQKRFGWYVVINRITENDLTKHETILNKGLIEVLNQTSFLISVDQEIEKSQKKLMAQQSF